MLSLLLALLIQDGSTDFHRAYREAWRALVLDARPAAAYPQLLELAPKLPLHGRRRMRVELDLVRCEFELGHGEQARSRLALIQTTTVAGVFQTELETWRTMLEPAPEATEVAVTETSSEDSKTEDGAKETGEEAVLIADSAAAAKVVAGEGPPPVADTLIRPGMIRPSTERRPVLPKSVAAERGDSLDLQTLLNNLDRRAALWRESLSPARKPFQMAALSGRRFGATLSEDGRQVYNACTFSFVHATRDDRGRTRNDWDVEFGSGGLRMHGNMVSDDRTELWDLGVCDIDRIQVAGPMAPGVPVIGIQEGHSYLAHVMDDNTDLWVVLQVLELHEDHWMIFRWRFAGPSR